MSGKNSVRRPVIRWEAGDVCCDEAWEAAYARFETPEEETRKFLARHRRLGINRLPKSLRVVELFCGRGNGLAALEHLGFENLEGVDLSASLTERYQGSAQLYVGDCRSLHFQDQSKDLVVVQGGLHHLPVLPDDLERVLAEISRILSPDGRVVIVEPWLTPFLSLVHAIYQSKLIRRAWSKLDALATMNEREATTYNAWLRQPALIGGLLDRFFATERREIRFGKILFLGRRRGGAARRAAIRRGSAA